jgi:multicomponent Na+:H+ antiporter subunit B
LTVPVRRVAFLLAAALLAALFISSFGDLGPFGAGSQVYGAVLNQLSVPERHITDVVAAVSLDFRSLDTLVEVFAFLAAVLGVTLALRPQPGEGPGHVTDGATGRSVPPTSDAVRVLGLGLTPLTVLFAIYLTVHGHLTPGGGFQGGVMLATGVLLIYLAGEFQDLHGLYREVTLERAAALGAGAYLAVGLLGLAAGGAFLENVGPLGRTGDVVSAGTVPLINLAVGLAIAGGVILLVTTFLHQTLVLRWDDARETPVLRGRPR